MNRVTLNRLSYALPFQKLFRPLTDAEDAALLASITEFWVGYPVVVFCSPTHGRSILDGFNRASKALQIDPDREVPVIDHGDMTDLAAEALALSLNADRRHLSADDWQKISAMRMARMKQVMTLRIEGRSMRNIASIVDRSPRQVRRDLDTATGGAGLPHLTHVVGADRKLYPAHPRPAPLPVTGPSLFEDDDLPDEPEVVTAPGGEPPAELALSAARRAVDRHAKALGAVAEGLAFLLASPLGTRLRATLKNRGVPLKGSAWPALDAMRAGFADLKEAEV